MPQKREPYLVRTLPRVRSFLSFWLSRRGADKSIKGDPDTSAKTENKGANEKWDGLSPNLNLKRRKLVDLGIQSAALIAALFGIGIAVVSVYNFKSKESVVLWLGYFAIVFTLLAFTFYLQKSIWEGSKKADAITQKTEVPPQVDIPPLTARGCPLM